MCTGSRKKSATTSLRSSLGPGSGIVTCQQCCNGTDLCNSQGCGATGKGCGATGKGCGATGKGCGATGKGCGATVKDCGVTGKGGEVIGKGVKKGVLF